jgi:4-hydroxy-3-methylbut-2-en-1-yl diphosphate synthase IspG/GcpE
MEGEELTYNEDMKTGVANAAPNPRVCCGVRAKVNTSDGAVRYLTCPMCGRSWKTVEAVVPHVKPRRAARGECTLTPA